MIKELRECIKLLETDGINSKEIVKSKLGKIISLASYQEGSLRTCQFIYDRDIKKLKDIIDLYKKYLELELLLSMTYERETKVIMLLEQLDIEERIGELENE